MQALTPYPEVIDLIKEEGGDPLKLCYQCGTCSATCPWNLVKNFIVRKVMHQGQLGLIDFESEELWMCATCKACVDRCPRGVAIIDVIRAMRRAIVEFSVGGIPDGLRISMKNISATGNPLGELEENRADWTKDLDIKPYSKGMDVLYFSCCIPAYDPSVQRVARATANVLKKAGVKFGILGTAEKCCGESVRKAGNEDLFKALAETNISNFKEAGVTRIVATSSHCYNTFKNEYPELGGEFEILHSSQFIAELIDEEKITFSKEINKKVTYHDACYLGRHNDVYDEPRKVLQSIPGIELVEMTDNRENSLCCGGGGGRIWMDTKKGERFSDLRIEQAIETGAEILAAACPYCILNFEDGLRSGENEDALVIKDIAELVDEAM
ncbi:MAG: (Fe-S)-binding protein [Dehalococcoidales bacterium]|nr:MAG: (Fe-S)-binding protein [Dehalococcoidales bacterium]